MGFDPSDRPQIKVIIISDSDLALEYVRKKYYKQPTREWLPENMRGKWLEPLHGLLFFGCEVQFRNVKSHKGGVEGNTLADSMAKLGTHFGKVIPPGVGHPSGHTLFSMTALLQHETLKHIEGLSYGHPTDVAGSHPATQILYDLLLPRQGNYHGLCFKELERRVAHLISTGEVQMYPVYNSSSLPSGKKIRRSERLLKKRKEAMTGVPEYLDDAEEAKDTDEGDVRGSKRPRTGDDTEVHGSRTMSLRSGKRIIIIS
ncbi:hypothetical protein F5Y18DRAFT_433035 [Xylariaceae sp. FL1019]|nr:hypothetical protein F5Y18DRAFT_433035 [Xylariaceae sp. FL1019]